MEGKAPRFFKSPAWMGGAGLAFLNLLLFGDLFWHGEGRVLSSPQTDLFIHFVAWRQFAFGQLAKGHLVLWNPHYLCGAPFFGGFESAILYPPNWLCMILPLAAAINLGIVLHVFLAGFFTYLWALRRGLHPAASFLSGVVFMWGGSYFLHLFAGHLPNLCAMAWAPLIFLALDEVIRGCFRTGLLLGVFAVSMQVFAGHPQYVYFTAILAGIYLLIHLPGHPSKFRLAAGAAWMYLGAALLSAVQLWTGLQAYGECGRHVPMAYRSASSFFFPPENLLTLFLPDFFGNLTDVHYWGRWYLWEVSLFIGVAAFVLVCVAFFSGHSRDRIRIGSAAGAAFLLSLGPETPLFRLLYHHAPFFGGLRGICKFDFLTALLLSLLAGMGLDGLLRGKESFRRTALFSAAMGLALWAGSLALHESVRAGLSGFWARWFCSIHWLKSTVARMGPAQKTDYVLASGTQAALSLSQAAWLFILMALLLGLRIKRPRAAYAILALSILELFVFARSNRPTFGMVPLLKRFQAVREVYRRDPGEYRVYGTASASLAAGGYDIWEDEPMVLGRYGRFVCASQGLSEDELFSKAPIFQSFGRIFELVRLKYIFSGDAPPFRVVGLPFHPMPRMKLMGRWSVEPEPSQALSILMKPGFDFHEKVLLESDPGFKPSPESGSGTVQWKDLSTDETEVTADLPAPAVLLVTDNYSAGWRIKPLPGTCQGRYRVMPGDYFLRAVPLNAGKHRFLMEYRPEAFVAGKWVSIISAILYLGLLFFPSGPFGRLSRNTIP
jgi:hypothetical protein